MSYIKVYSNDTFRLVNKLVIKSFVNFNKFESKCQWKDGIRKILSVGYTLSDTAFCCT